MAAPASSTGGIELHVIDGRSQWLDDASRLRAARLAVLRGYQQAADILSPSPCYPAHPDLGWFLDGLRHARRLAGVRAPRGRAKRRLRLVP